MTTEAKPLPVEPVKKREVKKLTIDITDPDAVFAAYPAFKKENFTKTVVDITSLRKAIRPIVNALYDAKTQIPGVNAYYAGAEPAGEPEPGPAHNQLA